MGVVTRLVKGRHAAVRLSSGRCIETSAGNLSLVAMGDVEILETDDEKNPRNFTHFVSVDLFPEENLNHEGCPRSDALPCISPVKEYQTMLEDVRGIGSPMQMNKMHVTMAILTIPDGGLEEAKDAITAAMQEFKDLLTKEVFYIGFSGIELFSTPCKEKHVVSEVKLGRHALALLRGALFERLGDYITDRAWRPHVTIFKRSQLTEEKEERIITACHGVSFGIYKVSSVSLRERKRKDGRLPNEFGDAWRFLLADNECLPKEL